MASFHHTLHFLLVLSLLQWSLQMESTNQPVMLESISNETEDTTVAATSCSIGNETCATTLETPTTELGSISAANLTTMTTLPASDPATTATTPVWNTTGSTTLVPTTTAVPSPTPPSSSNDVTKKVESQTGLTEGNACTCDLTAEECENNCCCDPDCRPYQVAVFSSCLPRPRPLFDDRMCHTLKTVIVNKTEHLIEETRPGALCIVKTNIATWVVHPTRPAILSQSKFRRTWSRARSSTWPQVEERPLSPTDLKRYAQDSPLLRFHPQHVQIVDLPAPSATSICSTKRPIRFLRSWTKNCVQPTPANEAECQRQSTDFFLQKMNIIADPASVNRTKVAVEKTVSCPAKLCAPVFSYNCSEEAIAEGNFSSCRNVTKLKLSFFNEKANMCNGVVKDLRLLISHNGTDGVESISVYFSLTNTSVKQPAIMQRSFSVDFQWLSKNVSKVVNNGTTAHARSLSADGVKRSGHPGYITGKPVRSGHRHKVEDSTKPNADAGAKQGDKPFLIEKINLSWSQHDWLSVFSPGACELERRHPVLFGEDIHVSCGLVLRESNFSSPENCTKLRINALHHLLGSFNTQKLLTASSFDSWGIVIGTFGDSNPNELSDWIPLIIDGLSMTPGELMHTENRSSSEDLPETLKCEGVVSAMEIRFLHSFVGSINNPQSKIIGASVRSQERFIRIDAFVLRFEPAQDLLWQCETGTLFKDCVQPLHLTTSVKFVDVSSPAVAKFAEPPGIHIRLPPDFFYPFMVAGNSSGNITPKTVVLVFICCLVIVNCATVKLLRTSFVF